MSDDNGGGEMRLEEEDVNIQDITRARKADRRIKAEQRRQLDLQRIRDMRSSDGIDPLQRCPKEIWGLIFDELDSEDKNNAWRVHFMFHDLMDSRRIQDILFPLLLKVNIFEDYVNDSKDDLRFVRLRHISKNIMKYYDRLTEETLTNAIEEAEAISNVHIPGVVSLEFGDTTGRRLLRRLLPIYGGDTDIPAKRFFSRALFISFCNYTWEFQDDDNIQELFNEHRSNLISLLGIIGDQIWSFRFTCYEIEPVSFSSYQAYILLQQYVCLMPNLKYLEVEIDCTLQQVNVEDGNGVLRQYPLPTLADLQRLSFQVPFEYDMGGDNIAFRIYEVVLQANQHVKILDFDEFDDSGFGKMPHHLIKPLPLKSFRACDDEIEEMRLENIQQIVNFNWKLQTITLSLDYSQSGTLASIMTLLRFLERFPTLETVKLKELNGFKFQPNDSFGFLKLPNLKSLELVLTNPEIHLEGNIHFFFSLQFLLRCEKLKTLKWKMQGVHENELRNYLKNKETEKMLDFRAGLMNLYGSNIWDVFPFLDTIDVKVKRLSISSTVCKHEYSRMSMRLTDKRNISFDQFMKSHGCNIDNSVHHCVLQE